MNVAIARRSDAPSASGPEDVGIAVRHAREAFELGRRSRLRPAQGDVAMIRLFKTMTPNASELSAPACREFGNAVLDCHSADVPKASSGVKNNAQAIDRKCDSDLSVHGGHIPLLVKASMTRPALASCSSTVPKPTQETSPTALRLAELAIGAGRPPRALTVLPRMASKVRQPIEGQICIETTAPTGATEQCLSFVTHNADRKQKIVEHHFVDKGPAKVFTANGTRAGWDDRTNGARTVTFITYCEGDITTPFGGWKKSGFGGRDNGLQAHDQYTQLKTIWIDLSDDVDEAVD